MGFYVVLWNLMLFVATQYGRWSILWSFRESCGTLRSLTLSYGTLCYLLELDMAREASYGVSEILVGRYVVLRCLMEPYVIYWNLV